MLFFLFVVVSLVLTLISTKAIADAFFGKSQESTILNFIRHPDELWLVFQYLTGILKVSAADPPKDITPAQQYCYAILKRVSRSFAFVIMELPDALRESICVFYLVLRGLDSVEDDMSIDNTTKSELLNNFYKLFVLTSEKDKETPEEKQIRAALFETVSTSGFGENDNEKELLVKFQHVIDTFDLLPEGLQKPIKDICKRMGEGMCEYLDKEVNTVEEYEKYCFYVAGLVGVGLSEIFVGAKYESEPILDEQLCTEMGLFLQKTNISRDYREDIDQEPSRIFYPREIWSRYVSDIHEMKEDKNQRVGVNCVNHMVRDALKHVNASLEYLSYLKNREVFRFCAIPQAMAIATLARCYNNPNVLKTVVKIRKGETLKAMCFESLDDVLEFFNVYLGEIEKKASFVNDQKMLKSVSDSYAVVREYKAAA